MDTGPGGAGDQPGGDLTPPGPPVDPTGAEVDEPPVAAAPPAPPPPSNPYGPAVRRPAPARGTDKALGWTGVGVTAAFCLPLAPLAGVVLAIVALARRRFRPRWVLVLCLVAGLGLTAFQASLVPSFLEGVRDGMNDTLDDEAERARDSGERAEIAPVSLKQGDCFDDPQFANAGTGVTEIMTVTLVPCDELHDAEAFATIAVPGDKFPGQAAIDRHSLGCVDRFAEFTGVRLVASNFDMVTYFPTAISWTAVDAREIHCVIGSPAEQVTGTLKGAGRGEIPPLGKKIGTERLIVGDCYDELADDVSHVVRRSCTKPHHAEVFALIEFKPGAFPGDEAMDRRTDARCTARFGKFVGVPIVDSTYTFDYWSPTKESWDLHDRVGVCAINNGDGARLTSSAKGSRR